SCPTPANIHTTTSSARILFPMASFSLGGSYSESSFTRTPDVNKSIGILEVALSKALLLAQSAQLSTDGHAPPQVGSCEKLGWRDLAVCEVGRNSLRRDRRATGRCAPAHSALLPHPVRKSFFLDQPHR